MSCVRRPRRFIEDLAGMHHPRCLVVDRKEVVPFDDVPEHEARMGVGPRRGGARPNRKRSEWGVHAREWGRQRLALGACCASAVFDATLAANAAATSAFRKYRLGLSVLDSLFASLTNSSGSSFSISRKKIPDECRFLRFAQRGAVGNHCGDQLSIG